MTPKHVLEVNLREIKALQVTCSHCGSVFTLPIPKMDLWAKASCFGCNTPLWNDDQDKTLQRVRAVLTAISQWHSSDAGTIDISFSVDGE